MSGQPRESHLMTDPADIDLYCLECGYNLRGLSGDPRRCPECGHLNPMGDLELPAEVISDRLHEMETAPALCVGSILFGTAILIIAVFAWRENGKTDGKAFMCAGIASLGCAGVWFLCVRRFRNSCMNKPGWKDALWQYHVSGLGLCLGIFGLLSVPAIIYLLMSYNPSRIEELGLFAATILCVAGALAIIGILGRRAHRRLKDILTPLQREVAVSISREFLRQQLRTARRW